MDGTGSAKAETSSAGGPWAIIASSSSSTIRWIQGRSAAARLTVNDGISIRRCRWCSGSSTPSRATLRSRPASNRGVGTGKPGRRRSVDRRGSASRVRAAEYPVTSQTSRPS